MRWSSALAALPLAVAACGLPEYDFASDAKDGGGDATGGSAAGGSGGTGAGSGGSSGTATGGSGATAGASGVGGATTSCTTHADCAPPTLKCNPATQKCVACLPTEDECPQSYYCAPDTNTCKSGCKTATDCTLPLVCDPIEHKCLGCASEDQCPAGQICEPISTACVPGCTPTHACEPGFSCCSGSCKALALDPMNCGDCGNVCPTPPNGLPECQGSQCTVKCTTLGSVDCNKNPLDGCEVDTLTDAANCGSCGKVCPGGQSCVNSVCS